MGIRLKELYKSLQNYESRPYLFFEFIVFREFVGLNLLTS
jgi:hypothetical protein